ncbi:MAG: IPT/TIG domain-containing protein [Ardenticatenaceae bacterium]|nr:IPT/TIG domain-containing protein [Ardenticatenaceae bacterium]
MTNELITQTHGSRDGHNLSPGGNSSRRSGRIIAATGLILLLILSFVISPGTSIGVETAAAQGGLIRFFDDMEAGGAGWNPNGFWHFVSKPEAIRVDPGIFPRLVKLPDAGHLPGAYSGQIALWYGQECTGTYIGCDFNTITQTENNGGLSTQANSNWVGSPGIDLTGVSKAYLEFKTWWEIEGVDVDRYDLMKVEAVWIDGGAVLGTLNPVNDVNGESFRPYSSGGLGQIGQWVTVRMALTPYVGRTLHIVFRFDTRDTRYNGFRGWLIDDVKVVATELAAPRIDSVEPQYAQAGSFVTIHGENFVNGATVRIGGQSVSKTAAVSTTEIQAEVPSLSPGTYNVQVTNPDGQQATYTDFHVTNTPAPAIESIEPNSGPDDQVTHVVIRGQNFQSGARALIATIGLANVTVPSASRLEADVPSGLPGGFQNVTVINPDGQKDVLQGGYAVQAVIAPATASVDGQTFTPGPNGRTTVRVGLDRWVSISVPVDCGTDSQGNKKKILSVTARHAGQSFPLSGPPYGGIWSGMIRARGGPVDIDVACEGGKTSTRTVIDVVLIDPSGYVYNAQTGARIPGAMVVLYYKDPTQGDVVWDAKKYDQVNPQTTNVEGRYGWDVPAGDYYVTVSHPCYVGVTSKVVTIPPPVTDLNIGMQPTGTCRRLALPVLLVGSRYASTPPQVTPTATATGVPASPTPTPTATPSGPSGIYGQVTRSGAPAGGLRLDLRFWNGSDWSTRATTTTGSDGRYRFTGVPGLATDQFYYVRYSNTPDSPNPGPGSLWSWSATRIGSYAAGATVPGGDFDVADVPLASPADGASVTLPAQFCWTRRSVTSDNYRLIVYDPASDKTASTSYLGYVSCVNVTGLPSGWPSGATYQWWVGVYQGPDPDATPYNYGISYGDREVRINFSAAAGTRRDSVLRRPGPEEQSRDRSAEKP